MTIKQIETLNKLISVCIESAIDTDGPYLTNGDKCVEPIQDFLNTLQGNYEVYRDEWGWPVVVEL